MCETFKNYKNLIVQDYYSVISLPTNEQKEVEEKWRRMNFTQDFFSLLIMFVLNS